MADESGDRGEGGWGGRGDSPGFGSEGLDPETLDFANVMAEYDKYAAEIAAMDRAQERPGRFNFTARDITYEPERGWVDKALDRLKKMGITGVKQAAIQAAPGVMPSALTMLDLLVDKYKDKPPEVMENKALGAVIGAAMPAAPAIVAFGKAADWAAKKAGLPARPEGQPTIGEQPTNPEYGVERPDDVTVGQNEFVQQPIGKPYVFSDGSTLILDPKAVPAQQPRTVGLRQVAPADDRAQIDQLLRRARLGRIS